MSSEEEALLGKGYKERCTSSHNAVSNFHVYFYTLGILLGSLSMGIIIGMSSPMIPDMKKDGTLNEEQSTWFGSLFTLGAMFGGVISGSLINILGRKLSALICGIPFLTGLLLIAYGEDVIILYTGRIISGIATGIVSLVVPTYISEIAPCSLRGRLGSGHQLTVTIGVFLVYAFGIFLSWRWLAIASAVPPTLLTIAAYFLPETPRYLILKHKKQEAIHSLYILRGKTANVEGELQELEESIVAHRGEKVTLIDIIKDRALLIPLVCGLALMFFQQGSGINCVMFYSKDIFKDAGIKSESMLSVALLLLSGLQVVFTFIACVIIDKTGRKLLLLISSAIMAVSLGTFGLYFQLSGSNLTWLALISLLVYIAAFAIGLGPIPWLMMSEVIPLRAKGLESGICTAFNWMMAFIVTKEFVALKKAITPQGAFWLFGGICVLCFLFTLFFLLETKGKTLEEIEEHYKGEPYQSINNDQNITV